MDDDLLYLNGEFMPLSEGRISVEDRGFQLGDGVYEVIKILEGRLVWLDDHLQRLEHNLSEIGLEYALARHDLRSVLLELAGRSGVRQGSVYVQVTRGPAPRDFFFPDPVEPTVVAYSRALEPLGDEVVERGVYLHPVVDFRWARCYIKSVDLLASVLAKEEARRAGADEALFVSSEGVVREGGSSNVFALIDGVLRTHPAGDHVLPGVTRRHILEIARKEGYTVEERAFTLQELQAATKQCEVFIASTLRDIVPVVRVGEHVVGKGRPGPVTRRLLELLRREQAVAVGLG